MTNNVNLREISLDILLEINEKEQYIHILLNEALKKYQYLEKNERAFISRVVRGTIERQITLDYVIDQVSKVPVRKMKPLIRNLMRMSVYQLMYMDSVPASAVCNEAVKLAQKRGFTNLKGFVNGVLRNVARQLPDMCFDDNIAVKYSIPENLAHMWQKKFGAEAAEYMMASFLDEKKISAMVNTLKLTAQEFEEKAQKEGINIEKAPYVKNAYYLSGINYLENSASFRNGDFQIQDISSALAVQLAGPVPGDNIVDVCAAPGGKTMLAAMLMNGEGEIISRDLTDGKCVMIEENRVRLGIENVTVECHDALVSDEDLIGQADMVIADLPCSGLGIIGRKPDIKYNVTFDKMKELAALQKDILKVVAEYVKQGGILMYSTCTLNKWENEENVEFIRTLGFDAVDISGNIPVDMLEAAKKAGNEHEERLIKEAREGYVNIIPGIFECDGFFMAKLRRR